MKYIFFKKKIALYLINIFLYFITLYIINYIIIPHVNFPYKTSIDELLIFYNITGCYSNGEYCHVIAIVAGAIIKYQGGHMMRNADASTVRSRQETFKSNVGQDT